MRLDKLEITNTKMYKGMVVTGEVHGKSVKNIDSYCFKIVQFVIKSYTVQ